MKTKKGYYMEDRVKALTNFEPKVRRLWSTMEHELIDNEKDLLEQAIDEYGKEKPHVLEHKLGEDGVWHSKIMIWDSDLGLLGHCWKMKVDGEGNLELGIRNN